MKRFRLCKFIFSRENEPALIQALSLFDKLEELGLFGLAIDLASKTRSEFELNLLESLQLEEVSGKFQLETDFGHAKIAESENFSFNASVQPGTAEGDPPELSP